MMDFTQARKEILSGLTISVALVPEAISFALLVGAAPQVGLWAAVFMALSTAIFGGRPGLISGATGATAVILAALVNSHGMEYLFTGVLVAGLIQLIIWISGAWQVFDKIPKLVMSGFLVALAIMIFVSQLHYLDIGKPSTLELIATLSVISLAAIAMWKSITRFNFPPALSALAIGILLGVPLMLPTVGDISPVSASLPTFTMPLLSWSAILAVLPYSFGVAISGLTESLIAVGNEGSKKKETFAQGLGNIVSSLFNSMGGCVLIGQTNLNLTAGAKHRLSSLAAALGLAIIILTLGKWIELIPLAGLIGVMVVVVIQTGDWQALKTLNVYKMIVLFGTTSIALVTHNLALGVIAGTILYYSIKKSALWQK
jgi:SulP family sulfate permease